MPTSSQVRRIVVLLSGGGSNFLSIAKACANGQINARIVAVISDNAKAYGLERAKELGICNECIAFDENNRTVWEQRLAARVQELQPDFVVLAGFMKVLSADFTEAFPNKIINIHPSLLPKYKGLNTHARAIEAGDKEAGCSVHIVTEQLDDGPILGQKHVPVLANDSPEKLQQRVLVQEHILYPEVLAQLCETPA